MTSNSPVDDNDTESVELPCYGIHAYRRPWPNGGYSGTLFSDLHQGEWSLGVQEDQIWAAAMNAIESMILAHYCAGVDITDNAYIEGIETAVEAASNNL